jgi:hypothetical protein
MKIPCFLQISRSQFLCNRPDGPLKASGRPAVSRSVSIEDVWTSRQHHPNARSSFSNFCTELDFSRHYLESFCKTSGRRGNTSKHCPAFQNIPGFLYKRVKELQRRPSGRGPDTGRNCANLEAGRRRPFGRGNLPSRRSIARFRFYQN